MKHDFLPSPASQDEGAQQTQALVSFVEFDRWMDEQVEVLIARWIHAAAPNAQRVSQRRQHTTADPA